MTDISGINVGAGTLKGMQISAVVDNADVNVYDGLSNAGTLIWASGNLKAKTDGTSTEVNFWGLPFSIGLYVEVVDQDADVLVVYE